MDSIRVFSPDDREYKLLSCAAQAMTVLSPNGFRYYVGETYFDLGQDWKWTTILCHRPGDDWDFQAINPALQKMIVTARDIMTIGAAVSKYFKGENCLDKNQEKKEVV